MTTPDDVSKNLCAHTIPLYGKHLIEASAGTGKTYNITRLYLRLLLERRLTVQQILVMTFTKDATEELRGRIDASIREAINGWQTLIASDEYFKAISQNISENEALARLETALLYLDEAAIFTIHGFCKRVLTQHAFATGITFNAQMETDCQSLILESCQDWYRGLVKTAVEQFELIAQFWLTPEQFLSQFSRAVSLEVDLQSLSPQSVSDEFLQQVKQAKADLINQQAFLFTHLVEVKKGAEKQQRTDEFHGLIAWLENVIADINNVKITMPSDFFNGRRFARSAHKAVLIEIFTGVNELKKTAQKIIEKITKAKAYGIVNQGIIAIRKGLKQKKEQQNILSFDDLISTLAQALTKQSSSNELRQRLLIQFPAALVDEFQDTDGQQFAILQAIYEQPSKLTKEVPPQAVSELVDEQQEKPVLYLIGDPKQAIYGFRGGDVFAYLSAGENCQYHWVMDTNWRSSPQLISAYNRLFWGASLQDDAKEVFGYGIPYAPVKASIKGQQLAIIDSHYQALQLVHFSAENHQDKKGQTPQLFRPQMAVWCANEIKRLLAKTDNLALLAKDIAILVRDGSEAIEIKTALNNAGLSAVYLSDRENLLKTTQAKQLLSVLRGILFVENERLFSAAIANPLMGFSPNDFYLLQQNQQKWQQLKYKFVDFRTQWQSKSFISMALALLHQHFTINNNEGDAKSSKDRILTNLLHLFELLQAASQRHHQGQELLFWFEQQISLDAPEGETELRLESDEDLIKIVTQHGSKGLEYPVVFIPFATRHKDPLKFANKAVSLISYHDQQGNLQLSLDGEKTAKLAMRDEAYAETVRLLYVAITRAKQRCYLLTTAFSEAHNSPLGKTLKWQAQTNIANDLQQLAQQNSSAIGYTLVVDEEENTSVEQNITLNSNAITSTSEIAASYQCAQFTGKIARNWWLSSFSAINKNLPYAGISKPDRDNEQPIVKALALNSHLLRFRLAKGAHTGNLLHEILEHTDFSTPNWSQSLAKPLSSYGDLANDDEESLIAWLDDILQSKLNNTQDSNTVALSLASLKWTQTLRESEFYFPMNKVVAAQLANLLTDHRKYHRAQEQHNSPIMPINLPDHQSLNGMMHGFIDLIFQHQGKYYLCDYKSSHLGDDFDDYQTANLVLNIEKNHYDLQYLIYSLALHRYLQQRLNNYDAKQHFGGVYYLYLRGMSADKNKMGNGIFYRAISVQELSRLDQLFLGQESEAQCMSKHHD
jgi:exodeoxyribonuclease V beta subunit